MSKFAHGAYCLALSITCVSMLFLSYRLSVVQEESDRHQFLYNRCVTDNRTQINTIQRQFAAYQTLRAMLYAPRDTVERLLLKVEP